MYPDPTVSEYLSRTFIPVKIHIKEQPAVFDRFKAQWTPTLLVVDAQGVEQHRFEGFLPAPDFLAQLTLGRAHAAFGAKQWTEAERIFREVVDEFPEADTAAPALYWAGVSRYKASNDPAALKETARAFETRYQDTAWAKKASVWRG